MRRIHILQPKLPAQLYQNVNLGLKTLFPSLSSKRWVSKQVEKLPCSSALHSSLCLQKGWARITGMLAALQGPTCGLGRAKHV